eukprot:2427598-Pyramimonas_sp.AAC.1
MAVSGTSLCSMRGFSAGNLCMRAGTGEAESSQPSRASEARGRAKVDAGGRCLAGGGRLV